jgi:hypothetical protein
MNANFFQQSRRLPRPATIPTTEASPRSSLFTHDNTASADNGSEASSVCNPSHADGDDVGADECDPTDEVPATGRGEAGEALGTADVLSPTSSSSDTTRASAEGGEGDESRSEIGAVSIGSTRSLETPETRESGSMELDPQTLIMPQSVDVHRNPVQIAGDIEELIELGIRHREAITWRANSPEHAAELLGRFRPRTWLNDDAVMEVLYRMTEGHPDVHVVESHDFAAAYRNHNVKRIQRWRDSPDLILIPVHLTSQQHWFLVSVQYKIGRVVVHENQGTYHRRLEKFLCQVFTPPGGKVEYQAVS